MADAREVPPQRGTPISTPTVLSRAAKADQWSTSHPTIQTWRPVFRCSRLPCPRRGLAVGVSASGCDCFARTGSGTTAHGVEDEDFEPWRHPSQNRPHLAAGGTAAAPLSSSGESAGHHLVNNPADRDLECFQRDVRYPGRAIGRREVLGLG